MGEDKVIEKLMELLPKDGQNYRWAVGHAACPDKCQELTEMLMARYKIDKILTGEIGPTIGTHVGPGVLGVFFMKG